MHTLQVHFSNRQQPDQPLQAGIQRVVRHASGNVRLGDDGSGTLLLAQFCLDERGLWLQVANGIRGIHVNGRPVRRMAMLRAGDAVYADGVEMLVQSACDSQVRLPDPAAAAQGDQRVVLRGVGGQHHGRSISLDRPRTVGRGRDAHIVIDNPAFPAEHARIERHGDKVLLRDMGSSEGSAVNGNPMKHCWLNAGDQVVFDGHHRFVVEVPVVQRVQLTNSDASSDTDAVEIQSGPDVAPSRRPRRWPWLLLSAVLLAVVLSALLLFGAR